MSPAPHNVSSNNSSWMPVQKFFCGTKQYKMSIKFLAYFGPILGGGVADDMELARPPRGAEAVACTIVHVTEGESRRPPKTGTQQQPQQPRGYPSMATAAHVLHRRPHFTYRLVGIECALDDAAVPVS
ncbi:hypothetical protein V9T40_000458 [Parthenolecanium corni]|uniref:Uncharacterized protein n=1 Tax=Parthenolecanium corni TaxID=536013 RepID=A0AAN9TB73_9HEMI